MAFFLALHAILVSTGLIGFVTPGGVAACAGAKLGAAIGTVLLPGAGTLLGILAGCVAGGVTGRTLGKMCDETNGVYRCEHCGHEWRA